MRVSLRQECSHCLLLRATNNYYYNNEESFRLTYLILITKLNDPEEVNSQSTHSYCIDMDQILWKICIVVESNR